MNWPRAGRAPLTPRRRGLPAPGIGHSGEKTGFVRAPGEIISDKLIVYRIDFLLRRGARVPLGTRKLELARQQEGIALRGRRPTKAEITPAKHPTGAPDGRCLLALGMGLPGEILAEKTNSRAGGEGTNRAMTE